MTPTASGYELAMIYIYQIALTAGANDADVVLWLETPSLNLPKHVSPAEHLRKNAKQVIELAEMTFLKHIPGIVTRRNAPATTA